MLVFDTYMVRSTLFNTLSTFTDIDSLAIFETKKSNIKNMLRSLISLFNNLEIIKYERGNCVPSDTEKNVVINQMEI